MGGEPGWLCGCPVQAGHLTGIISLQICRTQDYVEEKRKNT